MTTRALIIGAGIVGPATALALQQAGITAAVYEAQATGVDNGRGGFMTVMAGGLAALQELETDEAMRRRGVTAGGVEVLDASGAVIRRSSIDHDESSCPPFTVTRSGAAETLRDEAVHRGVSVTYGKRLVETTRTRDGIRAHFADGSTADGDLLIGADGVWSRTRTLIDQSAPAPRYAVTVVFGFDAAPGAELVPPAATVRFVPGRDAFVGYKTGANGRVWWFARVSASDLPRAARPADAWKQIVLDRLAGAANPAVAIIRAAGTEVIGVHAYDLTSADGTHLSTPTWHTNHTLLIGDAAHAADPAAGHGASMAVEDAVTLRDCLTRHSSFPAAFRAFESMRRPTVEQLTTRSRRMAQQQADTAETA